MTTITLGKPVLMKGKSPIYRMLKEQGCSSIYDVTKVSLKDIAFMIKSAIETRQDNMNIVKKIFSDHTRLNDWIK